MIRPKVVTVHASLLLLWAGFMAWLIISGEVYQFIGPRTLWVVLFGAVALTLAGFSQVALINSSQRRVSAKELGGLAAFLAPVVVLVVIPGAGLGSQAAARKASGGQVSAAGRFAPMPRPGVEVSFPEIAYASNSEANAARVGIADGYPVKLVGFVGQSEEIPDGGFVLTRFATFCCAADAIPYSVTVDAPTPEDYPEDTWLAVSGSLVWQNGELVLLAEDIEEVEEPKNPYI
jgi:uncharacterized repeat protein (TIGR03943 family)